MNSLQQGQVVANLPQSSLLIDLPQVDQGVLDDILNSNNINPNNSQNLELAAIDGDLNVQGTIPVKEPRRRRRPEDLKESFLSENGSRTSENSNTETENRIGNSNSQNSI